MISGTNQSKNTVSPTGARKSGIYLWGDAEATWGDTLATWGGFVLSPTNQTKSSMGTVLTTAGSPMGLLLSITYPTTTTGGTGAINQSKS